MGYSRTKKAIIVAYNGSYFNGYQRQKNSRTIEGELEKALAKYNVINGFSRENDYSYSSRTDKGVHALYQVISFRTSTSEEKIIDYINKELHPLITATGYLEVPNDFHARIWALKRIYLYIHEIIRDTSNLIDIKKRILYCVKTTRKYYLPLETFTYVIDDYLVILFISKSFSKKEIRRIIQCSFKLKYIPAPDNLILYRIVYPFKEIIYQNLLQEFLYENRFVKVFDFIHKYKNVLDCLMDRFVL